MLACAEIGVDLDHRAAGVKRAVVKRHGRRTVCPDGVVVFRSVERRVLKLGARVAPVAGLVVDDAAVDDGLICADETKIVVILGFSGTQRHVLKRYGAGAVEGIVAVVLGAEMLRIGHRRADVPCGLVRTQALERKILALGVTRGAHAVKGVVALAELDGVAALRLFGSGGKIVVDFTGAGIGNRAGCTVCESRRCNAHRDERNGKQRCDRTRGRFQKRLHAESPSTLIEFKSVLIL